MGAVVWNELIEQYSYYSSTLASPLTYDGVSNMLTIPSRPALNTTVYAFRKDLDGARDWLIRLINKYGRPGLAPANLTAEIKRTGSGFDFKLQMDPNISLLKYTVVAPNQDMSSLPFNGAILSLNEMYWVNRVIHWFFDSIDVFE